MDFLFLFLFHFFFLGGEKEGGFCLKYSTKIGGPISIHTPIQGVT